MPTTFRRWLRGRWERHSAIARLPLRRRTHCTCHPIRLHELGTGKTLSTPTYLQRLPHEPRDRHPKTCTPPTTWSTPTCRPPSTTPRNAEWNRPFNVSLASIRHPRTPGRPVPPRHTLRARRFLPDTVWNGKPGPMQQSWSRSSAHFRTPMRSPTLPGALELRI